MTVVLLALSNVHQRCYRYSYIETPGGIQEFNKRGLWRTRPLVNLAGLDPANEPKDANQSQGTVLKIILRQVTQTVR